MTDKPQLDHDNNGGAGGAKKPPATEWVVTRDTGLMEVPSSETAGRLKAGGRMATERDFAVAGIDPTH